MKRNFFSIFIYVSGLLLTTYFFSNNPTIANADKKIDLDQFQANPPLHVKSHHNTVVVPAGIPSPSEIKLAYHLPSTGGNGTIAIIDAYDDPTAYNDLNYFSSAYNLPSLSICSTQSQSQCFEKHKIGSVRSNGGWALEESLDVQWAHAIAPQAHILLVEARSASGTDLLNAVNYARNRSDVVAISMSWGGSEFSGESFYDGYFTSPFQKQVSFFASSGDSGSGVQWPAVSQNVIGVGGTTLNLDINGNFLSESAWSGSGGGLSSYEQEPVYQSNFGVVGANGFRAVPDVSFDADPNTGVGVYDTTPYSGFIGWFQVGGTSLGAPSWAAISSLGSSVNLTNIYKDAKNMVTYPLDFRDITVGSNGSCGFYCTSLSGYDYVTGLGSPLTSSY